MENKLMEYSGIVKLIVSILSWLTIVIYIVNPTEISLLRFIGAMILNVYWDLKIDIYNLKVENEKRES